MPSVMNLRTDVLIIIPARSGSIGVRNKNIRKVRGKPLLVWALKRALKIAPADNIIVSTDEKNYSFLAQKNGAKVRKLRPKNLSSNKTLIMDVIDHELKEFSDSNPSNFSEIKYVLILEPSHFGLRPNIDNAMHLLASDSKYNSAFGVYKVPIVYNFQKQYWMDNGFVTAVSSISNYNRQDLQNSFIRSGEFYLFRLNAYVSQRSLMPTPMRLFETEQNSVNIDTFTDLRKARRILNKQKSGA